MTANRTSRIAAVLAAGVLALAGCGTADDPATVAVDPDTPASESAPTQDGTAAGSADSEPTDAGSSPTASADPGTRTSENIVLRLPEEGAVVSGEFRAAGRANSPEANVLWRLEDASGAVAKEGYATADGWMDKLYPWRVTIDVSEVAPGDYTFVAMTDDLSGGAEGSGAEQVSARITVE